MVLQTRAQFLVFLSLSISLSTFLLLGEAREEVVSLAKIELQVTFLQILRFLWTRGDLLTVLRVYLSADSVGILQRTSQGTGPRFEASVRPRSSLYTVIPVWRIRVHGPCWVQDE